MDYDKWQVSAWVVQSMSNTIPPPICKELGKACTEQSIDGHVFSELANDLNGLLHLGVDDLQLSHATKIRKSWHLDFPLSLNIP